MDAEEVQLIRLKLAGFTTAYDEPRHDQLGRLARRFQHNSLPLSIQMDFINANGMFETACRIQHACRPNLRYSPGARPGSLVFRAIRPIAAEEELTINYCGGDVPDAVPSHTISAFVRERMGFVCRCNVCVA